MELLFGVVFAALVSFKRFHVIQTIKVNTIDMMGRNIHGLGRLIKNSSNQLSAKINSFHHLQN